MVILNLCFRTMHFQATAGTIHHSLRFFVQPTVYCKGPTVLYLHFGRLLGPAGLGAAAAARLGVGAAPCQDMGQMLMGFFVWVFSCFVTGFVFGPD